MKFFEGIRPQVYFDGGRLTKDKKTGKKIWGLKLVITLNADLIAKCDDVITGNYIAIETRENRVEEIVMSHSISDQVIEFFGLEDKTAPLAFVRSDITDLSITREGDLTELHFKIEGEATPIFHRFVGEHVFNCLRVQFSDNQRGLPFAHSSFTIKSIDGKPVN